jgi:hypothetical protein
MFLDLMRRRVEETLRPGRRLARRRLHRCLWGFSGRSFSLARWQRRLGKVEMEKKNTTHHPTNLHIPHRNPSTVQRRRGLVPENLIDDLGREGGIVFQLFELGGVLMES